MKTVVIRGPGGPDVLELIDADRPVPGPYDVLIKVSAAGVNRPDVLQRLGLYPAPKEASNVPGLEVAGHIVEIGSDVTLVHTGQKVTALTAGGGYSEYAIAHEGSCLPIPNGLSMAEAACIPETFMTVWHNVFERGDLKSSETFLVHGGSSGIGTTAIQLAKSFGARVFATAGSAEKAAFCEKLGAEHCVNYREKSFLSEIKERTNGRGVDVILDMVGGDYVQDNIALCADQGRIVQIAFLKGSRSQFDLMPLMLKRLTLTGSTLRPRTPEFKARLAQELKRHVWPLLESRDVKIFIDRIFPLAQAAEAHQRMESNVHMGKIVLQVNPLADKS